MHRFKYFGNVGDWNQGLCALHIWATTWPLHQTFLLHFVIGDLYYIHRKNNTSLVFSMKKQYTWRMGCLLEKQFKKLWPSALCEHGNTEKGWWRPVATGFLSPLCFLFPRCLQGQCLPGFLWFSQVCMSETHSWVKSKYSDSPRYQQLIAWLKESVCWPS